MGITVKQFLTFILPLALLFYYGQLIDTPEAPVLTPEQHKAVYPSGMMMFALMGAEKDEGNSAVNLANDLEKAGFKDAAKQWRDFHARYREHDEILDRLIWGAVGSMFVLGLWQFFFPYAYPKGPVTVGHLLEDEATPTVLLLLGLFLAGHPVYYSEFGSPLDTIPCFYALWYLVSAAKRRYKTWQSLRENPNVTPPENAASLLELSAGVIILSIWGAWYAFFRLELGSPALTASLILRLAALFAPWLAMFFHPRYSHLKKQGSTGITIVAVAAFLVLCLYVAHL